MLALTLVCFVHGMGGIEVRLVKTTFSNGWDLVGSGGTVVQLEYTSASISRMSIVSRVKGSSALLRGVESVVVVKDSVFDGLANTFAHLSGGSASLTSSSFANCGQAIRMVSTDSKLTQVPECPDKRMYFGYGCVSLDGCTFINLTTTESCGGALYVDDRLAKIDVFCITNCLFENCRPSSGWGAAVYSTAIPEELILDGCTFRDFKDCESVFHLQFGEGLPSAYGPLTFNNNTFEQIATRWERSQECGGSGLLVRFPTTLELVGCVFSECSAQGDGGALMFERGDSTSTGLRFVFRECNFNTTTATGNGGAISLPNECASVTIAGCIFNDNSAQSSGGSLYFAANPGRLTVEDTEFRGSSAGAGGCIYANGQVTSFSVDNVTVDACEAASSGYSLVVQAVAGNLCGLHIQNMPGGMGRLDLMLASQTSMMSLDGCTFTNFRTEYLLMRYRDGYYYPLTLTDCEFSHCVSPEGNLLVIGGDSGLSMVRCTFRNVTAVWAVVRCFSVRSAELNVDGCIFDDVVVDNNYLYWVEAVLYLYGIGGVTVRNTTFVGSDDPNRQLQNGPVMIQPATACSIALDGVHFENCHITRDASRYGYGYSCACLGIVGGEVSYIRNCTFVSCTDSGCDSLGCYPFLEIKNVVTLPDVISVLLFDNCSCGSANLVSISGANFVFDGCVFQNMDLSTAPVRFQSNTAPEFKNVTFCNVRVTGTGHLLAFQSTPNQLIFENVHIQDCAISTIGSLGACAVSWHDGHFLQNSIKTSLISLSGQSNYLELVDCEFDGCNCESSLIHVWVTTVNISSCTFSNCVCTTTAMINIVSAGSVFIADSCFQGLTEHASGVPAYISCTCDKAVFALPLCFSLGQEASVLFTGCDLPFSVSSSSIFNCDECHPVETEPPVPTTVSAYVPTPEVEDSEQTNTPVATVAQTSVPAQVKGGGLGAGVFAGIAITALVIIAVVVLVLVFVVRKRRKNDKWVEDESDQMNEIPQDTVVVFDEFYQKATEPMPEPAPAPRPSPMPAPKPSPMPAPRPSPMPAPKPSPMPAPKPKPMPAPRPSPMPAPKPKPEPEPDAMQVNFEEIYVDML